MGQVEVNNVFLLGMASKGVIRVREVVEKGGGGGLVTYGKITGASEGIYSSVACGIVGYYGEVAGRDAFTSVAGGIVGYSVIE